MPEKVFVLTESDKKEIKRLRAEIIQMRRNTKTRPDNKDLETFPDVYVALIPDGGIPGRVGSTVGSAECNIYRIFDSELEEIDGFTQTVYNLSTSAIDASEDAGTGSGSAASQTFIPVVRDKYGAWLATPTNPRPPTTSRLVTAVTCLGDILAVYSSEFYVEEVPASEQIN